MTVAELIVELQKMPQDREVFVFGCCDDHGSDCFAVIDGDKYKDFPESLRDTSGKVVVCG